MALRAITTKYLGPTNHRGSRVKAFDDCGNSVTLPYDSALDSESNHRFAALALMQKMGWLGYKLICGALKTGYVFVMTEGK